MEGGAARGLSSEGRQGDVNGVACMGVVTAFKVPTDSCKELLNRG